MVDNRNDNNNNGSRRGEFIIGNPPVLMPPDGFETVQSFRTFSFVMACCISSITGVGLIGNLLILIVYLKKQCLRKRYLFNIHLGLLHVIAAVIYIDIIRSAFGAANGEPKEKWSKFGCRVEGFLNGFIAISSVNVMVIISIERYIATCHPFKIRRLTFKAKNLCVIGAYIVSFLTTVPPLFHWSRFIPVGYGWYCCFELQPHIQRSETYFIYLIMLGFVIPFSIILACYSKIWMRIRTRARWLVHYPILCTAKTPFARQCFSDRRCAAVSITVVVSFLVSWLPFAITAIFVHFTSISHQLPRLNDNQQQPGSPSPTQSEDPAVGTLLNFGKTNESSSTAINDKGKLMTNDMLVHPMNTMSFVEGNKEEDHLEISPLIMEIVSVFAKLFIVYNFFIYGCLERRFRYDLQRMFLYYRSKLLILHHCCSSLTLLHHHRKGLPVGGGFGSIGGEIAGGSTPHTIMTAKQSSAYQQQQHSPVTLIPCPSPPSLSVSSPNAGGKDEDRQHPKSAQYRSLLSTSTTNAGSRYEEDESIKQAKNDRALVVRGQPPFLLRTVQISVVNKKERSTY